MTMGFSISGLGSGLDTAGLVTRLMQAERAPETRLQAQKQAALSTVSAWNALRAKMQTVQTAAEALRTPTLALSSSATSSDSTSLTATASASAVPGTYAMTINQLAVAQQQQKTGLGLPSMTVGAGRSYLTAGPLAGALDLTAATEGVHAVQVTRASAAPAAYGTPVTGTLAATDLTLSVDGGPPRAFVLQTSYLTAQDLVNDLNTKFNGVATASLAGGRLQITGPSQGAARTLQFAGGAAAALALPTTSVAGQDALLSVDGVSQTVAPQPAGAAPGAVALGASGITLSVGSSLAVSSTKVNVIQTTTASTLADLQSMINRLGSPASAALIAQNTGTTLVLSSTATGLDGQVAVTAGTPVLAGLTQTQAAKDASVTVAGLTVTRSTNELADVIPGLTVNLLRVPTDAAPRTVTVTRDSSQTSSKVKDLVDSVNGLLGLVQTDTKYNVTSKSGGPLVGDSSARAISSAIFSAAGTVPPSGTWRALSQIGIEATRDGSFSFDATKLTAALAQDPDGVAGLLAGFAGQVSSYAKTTAQTGGLLTTHADSAQADADAKQKAIDNMEVRMVALEKRYKAQFSALETAMSTLNSQSSSMAAALSGLRTSG